MRFDKGIYPSSLLTDYSKSNASCHRQPVRHRVHLKVRFDIFSKLASLLILYPAISATLQAQHATFISLASKTAALDAELKKIKALYTQLWRSKTGSMRDPFNDLDRSREDDFGLESLHVK
jgi:hypothetical protein